MYDRKTMQVRQPSTILFGTLECILASIIAGIFASLLLITAVLLLSNFANAATATIDITDKTGQEPNHIQHPENAKQGTLFFRNAGDFSMAPTVKTIVDFSVTGMIARATVKQYFRNPDAVWKEGIYVFPLPDDAAVDHLRMHIGQRIIEGQIRERQQARKEYEVARSEGKRASLVEQERPNIFTTSVANIGPHEEIIIEIEYQHLVRFDSGSFYLRFPMVVAPRYIPGNSLIKGFSGTGWAMNTDLVPDAERITPPVLHPDKGNINPVEININLDTGFPLEHITCSYHNIIINQVSKTGYTIKLEQQETHADRDFELFWQAEPGNTPRAAFFTERTQGENYGLIMLLPPENPSSRQLNREVIFVIDTSGSMAGTSIRQAKASLLFAISKLNPGDRFNIIQFNSYTEQLFQYPQAVAEQSLRQAEHYIDRLKANGGTEMKPALQAALNTTTEERYVRQVIFLTDGSIGNETELFQVIKQQLGHSRLFTIGIGSAPNSYFMSRAASFGRGTYTWIGKQTEVQEKMQILFSKLEHPVLTALAIDWGNAEGLEIWPQKYPDLYLGEPLLITIRASAFPDAIKISGVIAGRDWNATMQLQGGSDNSGISILWARKKIAALMDQAGKGDEEDAIKQLIIDTAMKFHLVSKFTSLVAIDVTPARTRDAILESQNIPVNLPAGWVYEKVFGQLPTTATPATLHLVIGLILLLAGIILLFTRKYVYTI